AMRRAGFPPWDPFPFSALRWMDYILPPPGTYTASLNAAAAPSDPAWVPPAPCWVVDLALATHFWSPEPQLMRLWVEQNRAVDHRVEQHLSNGRVRVILSTNWVQFPGRQPWGPAVRIVDDPELGMRTVITVVAADPRDLRPTEFSPDNM